MTDRQTTDRETNTTL